MSARNRQHNYPSLLTRVLRARERGIRAALAFRADGSWRSNRYRRFGTGKPLFDAWHAGYAMACYNADDWAAQWADVASVDLSAEMFDVCREIEATVPCGWPRERRECAA